jgi:hypothetical protein
MAFSTNKQCSSDILLPIAEFAYNIHYYQSTDISLFEADLGYVPRMRLDIMASTRMRRSLRGHLEVNFATHMADILKELKSSLTTMQEQ